MRIRLNIRNMIYLACTFLEAVVMILVQRSKRILGGKPQLDSTDIFLRYFLRHAFGRQPALRITCADRSDGGGAQVHTIMSAMNFSQTCGHTYVHTPLVSIDHGDRPMYLWVHAWEDLFNLGGGELVVDSGNPKALDYSTFHPRLYHFVSNGFVRLRTRKSLSNSCGGDAEYVFHPFLYYSDSHPDSYSNVIPVLRKKYYRDKSPVENDVIVVAVHMRRGDVGPELKKRFTPINAVCETVRQVKSILDHNAANHRISLYSQGAASDFILLEQMGVELFLDIDPIWTMQQLVEADILIMSKSSFSYVAALISDGIKLYEPFWHSPMSHWIRRNVSGRFSPAEFEHQIQGLVHRLMIRSANPRLDGR